MAYNIQAKVFNALNVREVALLQLLEIWKILVSKEEDPSFNELNVRAMLKQGYADYTWWAVPYNESAPAPAHACATALLHVF